MTILFFSVSNKQDPKFVYLLLKRNDDFLGFFIYDFHMLSISEHFASKKAGLVLALLFDVRRLISFLNGKEVGLAFVRPQLSSLRVATFALRGLL